MTKAIDAILCVGLGTLAVFACVILFPIFAISLLIGETAGWFHERVSVKKPDGNELSGRA